MKNEDVQKKYVYTNPKHARDRAEAWIAYRKSGISDVPSPHRCEIELDTDVYIASPYIKLKTIWDGSGSNLILRDRGLVYLNEIDAVLRGEIMKKISIR